jgi:hypothetical protein
MEQSKPVPVEVKVTWGLAWALWWRWMLFSLALGAIIYIPVICIFIILGIRNY